MGLRLANKLDAYNVRPRTVYRVDKKHMLYILEAELESYAGADIKLHLDYDSETFGLMLGIDGTFEHSLTDEEYSELIERLPEWFHPEEWFLNATAAFKQLVGTEEFTAYADVEEDETGFDIVIELLK